MNAITAAVMATPRRAAGVAVAAESRRYSSGAAVVWRWFLPWQSPRRRSSRNRRRSGAWS